ncbi:hypothetical protein JTB14_002830 [Gonioctena quinquepunctata]|nr:hypothetical protein JTB14_002830 [Gonioctena quinquepunctata]
MTAKKVWAKKFYHDSQEAEKNSQGDISWTSSDSECEEEHNRKKKLKTNKPNNWIKPPLEEEYRKHEKTTQNFFWCETIASAPNSPFTKCDFSVESPIITSLSQEELSPVLAENANGSDVSNETSPVIGKHGKLKKVRSRYKRRHEAKQNIFWTKERSPDIFQSQPSQLIDNNCSLEPSLSETKINISQSSTCLEPESSPCSSQITKHTSNTSDSSKTENGSLYHQPVRKRKHYKKGGLASQLQKTLRLQRNRIFMWHHEMYAKKTDSFPDVLEHMVQFKVKKISKQYGSFLLESELLPVVKETSVESDLFESLTSEETDRLILVVVSTFININFSKDLKYTFFPPYCSKIVSYRSRHVVCYYNVNKIMMSKR